MKKLTELPDTERQTLFESLFTNGAVKLTDVDRAAFTGVVSGWEGLAKLAGRYVDGGWKFRGQTAPHPLLPKIGRPDARKDASKSPGRQFLPHSPDAERWIFEEFKRRAPPHVRFGLSRALEWLAVARHHDMPTRLLDWTESFFAAVFFAVQNAGLNGPPIVYAAKNFVMVNEDDDPFDLPCVKLYRPPHVAARIIGQQGLFTVHPDPTITYDSVAMERWLIEPKASFNIKKHLHICGVNEAVLFPDIDGLAKHLAWLYKRSGSIDLF